VTAPRAVRIPRGRPTGPGALLPATPAAPEVRVNRGGFQRAVRIAAVYAGTVGVLTVILSVLDLTSADASRPGVEEGLELFLVVAVLLMVASAFYAISPAPRSVEVRPEEVVVVGRWGRRRAFGPPGSFPVQVVRHFAPGGLSPRAVDVVRIVDLKGRPATYEVESGIFGTAWTPS